MIEVVAMQIAPFCCRAAIDVARVICNTLICFSDQLKKITRINTFIYYHTVHDNSELRSCLLNYVAGLMHIECCLHIYVRILNIVSVD